MLDEFRSTYITWDKATSRIYSPVTANESDENGRKLVVQVVNSGQVEDLTGATLHLYWETRDKAHDGLDVFKAVDLKKGEFELSYTTGMLSNKGVLNANLVLIDTVGRVVSERFKITVTEGIDNDAIQSENSFSSLTQALITIGPRLDDLTAQLQQKADKSQIGAPTQEQVNTWLDANPQATTTVQDGAITDLKLADGAVVGRHINEEATTATVDHIYTRRHLGFSGSRKIFKFTFPETTISDGTCKIIALLKSNYITTTTQESISPLFSVDGVSVSPSSSSLTISEGVYKQESNYTVPNGTKNLVYSPYPYINLLGQTSIDLEVEIEVYILKNGVKIYPSEVTDTSDSTNIIILDKWRKNKLLNYGTFDSVIEEKKIITQETSNYIEFDDFKIDTLTVEDKNEYFFQVKNHTRPQATLTLSFGSVNIVSDSVTVTSTLRSANVTGGHTALGGSLTVDGVAVGLTSTTTTLNDGLYTSVREYPVSPGEHTIEYSLMPYVDFMGQDSITFEGVGTCEITDGVNVFRPITKTSLNNPLKTVVYNRFSDNQIVTAGKFKQILTDNSYLIEDQILALQSRWFKKKWIAVGDSITEMYRGTSSGYTTTQYGDNYQGLIGKKYKIEIRNKGVSGRGYTSPSGNGNTNGSFLDMLKTLEPNSCDLITIFGGVNDWQMPFLPMGTFDDMDTDTFYSRIRKTVEYVITNFPDATFALITPLPAAFSYGNNAAEVSEGRSLKTISDMIIEVGDHYSIPVLDMFRNSGMYPWDEEYAHKYFRKEYLETSDGLHPNMLGHQVMAHKIEAFINSL